MGRVFMDCVLSMVEGGLVFGAALIAMVTVRGLCLSWGK